MKSIKLLHSPSAPGSDSIMIFKSVYWMPGIHKILPIKFFHLWKHKKGGNGLACNRFNQEIFTTASRLQWRPSFPPYSITMLNFESFSVEARRFRPPEYEERLKTITFALKNPNKMTFYFHARRPILS